MFLSTLPDLIPRDSHNLWYTSRQNPTTVPHHLLTPHDPTANTEQHHQHAHHPSPHDRDARRALIERTPFARLRHDEAVMDRRRANVANYATQWLKPPGVAKTLQQIREERREALEHAEVVERERALAQMAEAVAAGDGADMMEDEDEEIDLDDDVPEGETFGFDGEDDEMPSESSEEDDDDDDALEETEVDETDNAAQVNVSPAEEEQVREVRAAEDRLMNRMAREENVTLVVGEAFGEEVEASEEMLEEDDLVSIQLNSPPTAAGNTDASTGVDMDMDMDADLDGEVPDGDVGNEYEHTDSDEEIDESTREISFVGRSSVMRPRQLRRSVHRSSIRSRGSLAQSEVADISELLSGEGSSFIASPYPRRRG